MSDAAKKRENRKTFRIDLAAPLRVSLSSLGAHIRYEMVTHNISTNGFFLNFDKPGRFPFTPSSIMEVWMELEPGNEIFFNGKMARIVHKNNAEGEAIEGTGIAIKIVQIDKSSDTKLKDFIMARYVPPQAKPEDSAA